MVGEILKLDQYAGEHGARRRNKFVDERVISRPAQPLLAQPDIIGIVQQRLVVGADIKHHRQAELGMNTGTGCIEREFADRNSHAVGAEIAEAEDPLAIGNDDQLRRVRPIGQQVTNTAPVVGADEQSARPLENVAEPLAGEPDRRRVNERLDLVDIVADNAKEQRLVAIMQRVERHVFLEVIRQPAQVGHNARGLLLHREDVGRQQAAQAERVALLFGKCRSLV